MYCELPSAWYMDWIDWEQQSDYRNVLSFSLFYFSTFNFKWVYQFQSTVVDWMRFGVNICSVHAHWMTNTITFWNDVLIKWTSFLSWILYLYTTFCKMTLLSITTTSQWFMWSSLGIMNENTIQFYRIIKAL